MRGTQAGRQGQKPALLWVGVWPCCEALGLAGVHSTCAQLTLCFGLCIELHAGMFDWQRAACACAWACGLWLSGAPYMHGLPYTRTPAFLHANFVRALARRAVPCMTPLCLCLYLKQTVWRLGTVASKPFCKHRHTHTLALFPHHTSPSSASLLHCTAPLPVAAERYVYTSTACMYQPASSAAAAL